MAYQLIVLVTGSRGATYEEHFSIVTRTLAWAVGQDINGDHTLIDGEAAGLDEMCHQAAVDLRWKTMRFPVNWAECDPDWTDPLTGNGPCRIPMRHTIKRRANGDKYCPVAGFRRNQEMVDTLLRADEPRKVCVAFPVPRLGSHGTSDCLTRAWRAGIPTLVIPLP